MARYIDVEKKIKEMNMKIESITRLIENRPYDEEAKLMLREFKYSLAELIDTPTVEAAEVKHGYWEYSTIGVRTYCECSICGEIPDCFEPHYCPNCGAKMDGGRANDL